MDAPGLMWQNAADLGNELRAAIRSISAAPSLPTAEGIASPVSPRTHRDAFVDEIFDRALDVPIEERASFLDRACGGDDELHDAVERLLEWSSRPPSIFARGALARGLLIGEADNDSGAERSIPERVGPYRILRELGRGGMGVVYLAERDDGHFEQQLALKVMRPGSETPETLRRFEQERQIIASLSHPSIAHLYDGGVTEDGRPYSAMEFVEGQPIDRYCDDNRLDLNERLRLFEVVAGAVHYAHQNLIVHRDLKPSNILVTRGGEIKLLDFGIAKLLDPDGPGATRMTRTSGLPMTPLYAAPEQLRGDAVTTASDVFQLGLLLFELLSGEPARRQTASTPAEALRSAGEPARRPSTALHRAPAGRAAASAAARRTTRRALERSLRSELDLIVLAALRPEPERRYPSAAELVEDLRRYRRGFPLSARPDTLVYRVQRFVRRHRVGLAVALVFLTLLIAYSVTVTFQARKISRERDRAQRIQAFALGIYGAADPNRALGPELSASELVAHGVERVAAELEGEPDVQAELYAYLARVYLRLGRYQEAEGIFRNVLDIRRRLHGESHPEVATAMNDLGRVLLESEDSEAFPMLDAALEQRRRYLGDEHPETAQTLVFLGTYLYSLNRFSEAEVRLREAVEIYRRVGEDARVELAGALSELAWVLRRTDRPEEGESLLREACATFREQYGDMHPEVATCFNNLAAALWAQRRWEEGDAMIDRSIEIQRGLYGTEHPDIATSLGNLAGSLADRGDLARAA